MSHKEFIQSIRDGDGRKWIIDEVKGQPVYLETFDEKGNPYSGGEGWATKRKRLAREQLAKKVGKEHKPFTWRLGYNHCIGQFTPQDGDYPTLSGSSLNRKKKEARPTKKKAGTSVHLFSRRSRGKVKDKATAFFRSTYGDRIFLTLTFIQHVDDQTGVKILNKFLTVVRKERPGVEYLWVAEHQPDRREKTIHFHILMNRKLAVQRYNGLWTLQQYNAGLVGHRKNGEAISRAEISARYKAGTVHQVLGPAQMRNAKSVHGLALYLTAYVTKQDQDDPFGCLNWHCSRKVSKLFTRQVVGPSTFAYLNSFTNWKLDKRTGETAPPIVLRQQFFTMVYVHNKGAPLTRLKQLETVNKWIIENFEPDGVPRMDDRAYRKTLYNEKEKVLETAPDVPRRYRSLKKQRQ